MARADQMVRDPFADEDAPDLQEVLDALDDPDCRDIVTALEEPMTADQISEAADVPLSTTYRKLDLLSEASLLEEGLEIRSDGQHASRYAIAFEEVIIALTEDRDFDVQISRRPRAADERLANLWSEVRKET
jgi:DNA-binding IclR family transcriptional regulator